MKIAVYAISKNEELFVQQFCNSAKDADLILIADTGSTDQTVRLAREHGATVYEICVTPWRFDRARDAALSLLPKDIDVCVSLDLDERLEPGWRNEIERCWNVNTTRLSYLYDWGSGVIFHHDKIHARHGYHWHNPCHEQLRPDYRISEKCNSTDQLLITHHPDPNKSRMQYLPLLELAVKEDPHCHRSAFYYARELTFYQKYDQVIDAFQVYLDNPRATWASERAAAMRMIGEAHGHLGNAREAIRWCRLACAESPSDFDPWVALAEQLYYQQDWLGCYTASITAMNIKYQSKTYLTEPAHRGSKIFDLAAMSSYYLGRFEESATYGKQAVDMTPDDARLSNNLQWYLAALDKK